MSDPKRLRDGGGSEELRRLVAHAEEDLLSDAAEARLAASLAATGIAADPTPSVGATRSPWWAAGKGGLLLSLLAGAAALGVAYEAMSLRTPTAATSTSAKPTAETPTADTPAAARMERPTLPAPSAMLAAPPVASFAESASASPSPASAGSIAPRPLGSRRAAEAPRASSEVPSAPTPREGLLLMQARQALDVDPARALELVEAHERQFPRSQLAPERATLRREALARISR